MPTWSLTGIRDAVYRERDLIMPCIWVCGNQENEIVVIDPKAKNPISGQTVPKVIAKLGDFYGIDDDGVAQGFLFPANPAFNWDARSM